MPDMLAALLGGGTGGAGDGSGGLPEQFAQMFGGGAPGSTPIQLQAPRQKTWTDRLLPLVHLISMVSLAFYAVCVLEPRLREGYSTFFTSFSRQSIFGLGQIDWNGWAALGRGKQADSHSNAFAKAIEDTWEASGRGVATVVGLARLFYNFTTDCWSFSKCYISSSRSSLCYKAPRSSYSRYAPSHSALWLY